MIGNTMKTLDWTKPENLRFENCKNEILEVLIFKHEEITHPVIVAYRGHDRNIYFKNFTLDGFYYEDKRESPFNIVQIIRKTMKFEEIATFFIKHGKNIWLHKNTPTAEKIIINEIDIHFEKFGTGKKWLSVDEIVNEFKYSILDDNRFFNFYTEEKL